MEVPRFRTYVEDVPEHACDLNTRLVVEMAVFGTEHPSPTERFTHALRLASVVSRRHPYTKSMFRSTSALAAEVARHMETAPHIIHPYSVFRSNYEIYMLIVYLIFCAYVPLYVWALACEFSSEGTAVADVIYLIIIGLFYVDIALNFCTGYVNRKLFVVVLDSKLIARRYILSYLLVDLLSTFPYSWLLICQLKMLDKSYFWIEIIVISKLLRLPTIFAFYKQMAYRLGLSMVTRQVLRIIVALVVYLHWVACMSSTISSITETMDLNMNVTVRESAMWALHYDDDNVELTWRNAMLRAITLTFACGFRIIFTEFGDMLANIIFFLVGIVVVVLVAVRVVVIARTVQMRGAQFEALQTHLVEYMRHKQVTPVLERRLLEYYRFCFERTYYHEPAIISFLSGQLQKDVLLQKGRVLIEATDVFGDVPPSLVVRLVAGLRTSVVLPGDFVMRIGQPADRMVFVASGTLAIYDKNGMELCHLSDGQHVGSQALVAEDQVLGVNAVALEPSELWELSRSHFMAALGQDKRAIKQAGRMAASALAAAETAARSGAGGAGDEPERKENLKRQRERERERQRALRSRREREQKEEKEKKRQEMKERRRRRKRM